MGYLRAGFRPGRRRCTAVTASTINDCFAADPGRISHDEAVRRLKTLTPCHGRTVTVPLDAAGGRIIAAPVSATFPVPAHTNSAVDGYAFAAAAYDRERGSEMTLQGVAAAGRPLGAPGASGGTVRILTGAVMPAGFDTVAMQEDCAVSADGRVRLPAGLKPGANVRKAGEDLTPGTLLFEAGHGLRPQDLAALASVGHGQVRVFERVRVGVVSTGDEVREPGSGPLPAGGVYDANAAMIAQFARLAGCDVTSLGIWRDQADLVRRELAAAAERFDVIITSGGASRGDEDHMSTALASLGTRHFWQIAIKPGRPMMLGQVGQAAVVGLPGNPVAVFVCFLMYGWPLLRRLGGARWDEPRRLPARATFAFANRKTGRREFWRGLSRLGPQGLEVEKYKRDGSGLISSLRESDCLIDVPEDVPGISPGDIVQVIPYSEFGIVG